MKFFFHKTLFIITILLLTLMMIQTMTGFINLRNLKGAMTLTEMPRLTYKSYADNSFQRNFEQYAKDHLGFREWALRLYNQYVWSCYHTNSNSYILVGPNNWLFESDFVMDHYESAMYKYTNDTTVMKKTFENEALRLLKVQELLKEHDVHIFVNLIPGKDVIFPEHLPENTEFFEPDGLHAYDYYKKRFNELGINYIDNVEIFKKIKNNVDYKLFTKTGTHWSNIASTYVFDSIINYMEVLGNKNITNLEISEKYHAKTREPDDDLGQLLNLAWPIKSEPNLYADVTPIADSTAVKPYFITVGDSYYWNFVYNIPLDDIFQKHPYWYYNSTIYFDNEHSSTIEVDMEKELMRADYIMLNYCTVQLYKLGNQFIAKSLIHLCYDKPTIDSVAENVINTIKSDPQWYQNIVEKAQNLGISVDEALYNDAIYVINIDPENYFEELKGEKLPVSRNRNLIKISDKKTISDQDNLQKMINYIYSDQQWLKNIKTKARENGVTLEEQVTLDARWMLDNY